MSNANVVHALTVSILPPPKDRAGSCPYAVSHTTSHPSLHNSKKKERALRMVSDIRKRL